jgi:hypothetical protein
MSKFTTAVIMPSPARLAPWGDDRWQFAGAIQYVSKGPDFLWAQSPSLNGVEDRAVHQFASMTVRDNPVDKAADIAVMVFALLQIDEWPLLHPWWSGVDSRKAMLDVLDNIAGQYRDRFKLAVVNTSEDGLGDDVLEELRGLGFVVRVFDETAG